MFLRPLLRTGLELESSGQNITVKPVWSPGGDRVAVTNQQGGSAPESIQILHVATRTAETIYSQRFLIKEEK